MTFSLKPGWPWRSLWSILGSGWAFTTGNDILARCVVALHSLWDHAVSLFFCSFSLFFSKSNHSCILYRPQLTEINLRFVSIVGEECDEFQGNLLHLSFANFETACLKPVKPCSTFFFFAWPGCLDQGCKPSLCDITPERRYCSDGRWYPKVRKKRKFLTKEVFLFRMGCRPSVLSPARGMMVAMEEPLRGVSGFNPA